eukprot:SAG31_NODE_2405_length_5763_cov_4.872881_2_plen_253_part_00
MPPPAPEIEFGNPLGDASPRVSEMQVRTTALPAAAAVAHHRAQTVSVPDLPPAFSSAQDAFDTEEKRGAQDGGMSPGGKGLRGKIPNPLKLGVGAAMKGVGGVTDTMGFMSQPGKSFVRKVKDNYSPEETARREVYRKCLQNVHLLDGLPTEVEYAINCLEEIPPIRAGDDIIREGQRGDAVFFVIEGTAEAWVDGEVVKSYFGGDSFGELALIDSAPRAATVKAVTTMKIVVIRRKCWNQVSHVYHCLTFC